MTWVARAIARIFYRVDAVGVPPARGPLLLLPNHPNALLDPALVIATAGRPVRFLAKSTLFTGAFGPLMRAAGAIPVYRRQDDSDVKRNAESFAAVADALARGEAICIFPEGISHSSGMLEPLRTGAARMALSAAAAGVDVRLVAIGINLEQKTAFRSRVTIAYGEPVAVTAPANANAEASKHAVGELTADISERMRSLLVEAEPTQDAALVERWRRLLEAERPAGGREESLDRSRLIAEGLQRLRRERPEWYEEALIQLRRYDDRLRRFGLADGALDFDMSSGAAWRFALRELPLALLLVPLAAVAVILFAAPYGMTAAAARLSKDTDVTATMKALGGIGIYGLWISGLSITVGVLLGAWAGAAAMVLLPALAVAGLFAVEREWSAWRTARSWLAVRGAQPTTTTALKRRRGELAGVLEQVYQWMQEK